MGSKQSTMIPSSAREVQYINDVTSQNCVVVFSKTYCTYCKGIKKLFDENGILYKAIELDTMENGREIQDSLRAVCGAHTVPKVFIDGNCVGGANDTYLLHNENKLFDLIRKCQDIPEKH